MLVRPNSKRTMGKWTERTPSLQELRGHLRRGGNFSVRTGLPTDSLVVLDIDMKPRVNGMESILTYMKEEGFDSDVFEDVAELAEQASAPLVKSPHGFHLYFRGTSRCYTDLLPGVDIRGTGGMIMVPPSRIDGLQYAWASKTARLLFAGGVIPMLPRWLSALLSSRGRKPSPFSHRPAAALLTAHSLRAIKSTLLNRPDFPLRGQFDDKYRFTTMCTWQCPACDRTHDRENLFLVERFKNEAEGSVTVALRCFKRPSLDAYTFLVTFDELCSHACSEIEDQTAEDTRHHQGANGGCHQCL